MRVGIWRWLMVVIVVPAVVAVGAIAQPAEPEPRMPPVLPVLPDKTAGKAATDDTTAERAKLQSDLLLLLRRISASPGPTPYPSGPPTRPKGDSGTGSKSLEPIREGMNLFRDNDFEGARRTFQLIDPTVLGREDRAFVRYMLGCSLRRQNRINEAEAIYREVANSPDDEFLANCASWQLSLIRSDQELQLQLEQLRSRAKSK
jgi:hypothetical protein